MHHRACWIRNNIFQHMQHLYSDLCKKIAQQGKICLRVNKTSVNLTFKFDLLLCLLIYF